MQTSGKNTKPNINIIVKGGRSNACASCNLKPWLLNAIMQWFSKIPFCLKGSFCSPSVSHPAPTFLIAEKLKKRQQQLNTYCNKINYNIYFESLKLPPLKYNYFKFSCLFSFLTKFNIDMNEILKLGHLLEF